jgi:hypothetical protein
MDELTGSLKPVAPSRMAYTSPVRLDATVEELLLEATGDVDRGLIEWSLGLSLRERLRAASKSARTLDRLHRGASKDR